MRIKVNYALVIIFILALFLRVVKLDFYPASLSWDEVAIGYNAFTISQKGIDEYGTSYPLLFRSFEDFKLPGYIYTDSIFIKLLGFSDFTTRLPSAVFGSLLVIVVYFLFRQKLIQKIMLNVNSTILQSIP